MNAKITYHYHEAEPRRMQEKNREKMKELGIYNYSVHACTCVFRLYVAMYMQCLDVYIGQSSKGNFPRYNSHDYQPLISKVVDYPPQLAHTDQDVSIKLFILIICK